MRGLHGKVNAVGAINRVVQQPESKLLTEFLAFRFPTSLQWKRVRVGPAIRPEDAKMYSVLQRWVDAVVVDGQDVVLVEAKMRPDPGAIGQLQLYRQLFPNTPEFAELSNRKVRAMLVTTSEDAATKILADQNGVEYEVFAPPWTLDYLSSILRVGRE